MVSWPKGMGTGGSGVLGTKDSMRKGGGRGPGTEEVGVENNNNLEKKKGLGTMGKRFIRR